VTKVTGSRSDGFIGVLLQLNRWNNVFNTSTLQLPPEFSSTDGFSAATQCLTHKLFIRKLLDLFGNTMNLEEPVVSRVTCLSGQSQSYFTTGGLPPKSSSWRQAP
jgi:hypothetical protein